jgi:hypothetical protein
VISIVIPLYNKASHIGRALDSVLVQTVPDFEALVVDDGSTDGSDKVVECYTDSRIRLIRQANAGVSAARNRGIAEARGDLVAFLDADDEWLPGFLETILRLARLYPACGAYATSYDIAEEGGVKRPGRFTGIPAPPWEGIIPNFFRCVPVPVWISAAAVPRRVFDTVGLFPVGVQPGEDADMWCRIALKYPIAFSHRTGAVYHLEAENRACRRPRHETPLSPIVVNLEAALANGALPAGIPRQDIVEYKNKEHLFCAWVLLGAGEMSQARAHARAAASTRRFGLAWRVLYVCLCSLVPPRLLAWVRRVRRQALSTQSGGK